ncbi:MAG: response regulator [Holosporaceae bacterium]|jgi:two-component system cell cycle sensor histidine kinase/response regulator CckA|nr:response regulator [Holosporaceae bacterium]
MDFLVNLDTFLSKKQRPVRHVALTALFLVFALFAIVAGISDENYFSVAAVFFCGFVCYLFSREIKATHERGCVVAYQKSLATNGFDASAFAFFVFSKGGKCVFVNRVAQNLFPGFKVRSMEDFIFCFGKYPKITEAIRSLQISVENMKQSHIDAPVKLRPDYTAIWRIAASPIPQHSGFSGWTIADITPSNSRIESPETNAPFLLSIVNSSKIGCFCLNQDKEITFCNKAFADWLDVGASDILNATFDKRIIIKEKSDDLPVVGRDNKPSAPARIVLKSPKVKEGIEVIVRLQEESDGNKIYSAVRESQRENDLVQALSKAKLYFEHIFEDAPVGIAVTDGAEIVSACNQAFRTIVGVDNPNESSLPDYISDEDRESVREKLYQLITGVDKSIVPFEISFKTQKDKTVMVYATKLDETKRSKDNDGLIVYFVDITERKKLQQQFVQSQKMQAVGQLAGGIAHDFNNLLTAMIGYCDLLLEKCLPSDRSFNDVMQIKQNANRASNLVRQLLAFSRRQTLQPKVCDVTEMIGELSALLKRLLGAKIELKIAREGEIGFIKVDQVQFEQVVINLAVNARDAMPDGGTLTIRTSSYSSKEAKFLRGETMPPGSYVLIEVIDAGCGIEEKNLNRIFDPFYSSKEKGRGTGLGLSTVYGIVNQTGGFISVESEIGKGTNFGVYFPIASPQERALSQTKEKLVENKIVDLTGTATILLVEDEDAVRMFGSRALRDKGYRVIEAANGESALEYIQKGAETIDLVITDVVMPKMDGPTLMKYVKERAPNMKIVFISGYTEDSFRDSLPNDGRVFFLPKPFNLKELASKVKEALGEQTK